MSPHKEVRWLGSSRASLRALPYEARRELGYELGEVQHGALPTDWRPMPTVGAGVIEIRVRAGGAFRLLFVAQFEEAIYVLHVFQKKSHKTSALDLTLARQRYRTIRRFRNPE